MFNAIGQKRQPRAHTATLGQFPQATVRTGPLLDSAGQRMQWVRSERKLQCNAAARALFLHVPCGVAAVSYISPDK
jgi:hypothetical protein